MSGKVANSKLGWKPLWERGEPPRLSMAARIRGRSADELDELMVSFLTRPEEAEAAAVQAVPGTTPQAASQTASRGSLSIAHFFCQRESSSGTGSLYALGGST